jgi:hypothetical protein
MTFKVVFNSGDPWYYDKFTIGKIYDAYWKGEAVDSSTGYYTVECDTGEMLQISPFAVHHSPFMPLEVWREKNIDEILTKF